MNLANQLFGISSVVSYIRSQKVLPAYSEDILKAMSIAFGSNSDNGIYLFNSFSADKTLIDTMGFDYDSPHFIGLENAALSYESYYLSAIGIASLTYGYSTYGSVDMGYFLAYINKYNTSIKELHGLSNSTVFTEQMVNHLLESFSLPLLNSKIAESTNTIGQKSVNYNWYDSWPLFDNLDLNTTSKIIRDSENQYYFLSGELLYSEAIPSGLPICRESVINISTVSGIIQSKTYSNIPCYDRNSVTGPVSGTKFFKIFNDGPGSSGYFDKETTNAYIDLDKGMMDKLDYSFNNENIYSYYTDENGKYIYLNSGVQVDLPGFFYPSGEYGYGKTSVMSDTNECVFDYENDNLPLMRMHQGDNDKKWLITKSKIGGICTITTGLYDWTGWKFAGFELSESRLPEFSSLKINPQAQDTKRVLKRALDLNNNKVEEIANSIYLDALDTGDGVLSCSSYAGPPQLGGYSSVPGFCFYQRFFNENFPDNAEVVIYPAISFGSSTREFDVSKNMIYSGKDTNSYDPESVGRPKKDILIQIHSSGLTDYDDVFKKCMAIGDNFGNLASGTASSQSNAGYLYTGYDYYYNGEKTSLYNLLLSYGKKIGDQYAKIKYINGYYSTIRRTFTYATLKQANIITGDTSSGIDKTGESIKYYYFNDNEDLGATNKQWDNYFAPIPSNANSVYYDYYGVPQNYYDPVYDTQRVENYFPRYYNGPYMTYDTKFLYPNASGFFDRYKNSSNGFLKRIKYKIQIKEETVREVFKKQGFDDNITHVEVIRAGDNSQQTGLKTLMVHPFLSNSNSQSARNKYDYTKNSSLYSDSGEFYYYHKFYNNGFPYVNAYYVPSLDYCSIDPRNDLINVNSGVDHSFQQGVKVSGSLIVRTISGANGSLQTIKPSQLPANHLYWGYKGTEITGYMTYIPPLFDLESHSLKISNELSNTFGTVSATPDSFAFSNNGSLRYGTLYDNGLYNGKDPMFYEYVGGRVGSGADLEGGSHSEGIVGDSWYGLNIGIWGNMPISCQGQSLGIYRDPSSDRNLLLLSFGNSGLDIHTKGLYYYPYYVTNKYKPFTSSSPGNINVTTTHSIVNHLLNSSEYYYDFDLRSVFPLKSVSVNEYYTSSGHNIGPFDRDVELCVTGANRLIQSGALLVDGEMMALEGRSDACPQNWIDNFNLESGIIPGKGNRNAVLTTFKLVPSGKTVNINISGNNKIGFSNKSIVTIRPRTAFHNIQNYNYDGGTGASGCYNYQGDPQILNAFNFINNNSEQKISFSASSYNDLIGKEFSITTNSKEDLIFPIPDPIDFDSTLLSISDKAVVTYDRYGNKVYTSNHGPTYEYWKKKNPSLVFSGIREVSRINIKIIETEAEFDEIPFQNLKNIIPTGTCTLSGVFVYTGQAESAIVSQGIALSGEGISSFSGLYEPIFVSNVLKRLPTGMQLLPSGSGIYQVLDAPSYMKKRKYFFNISGNDTYINASPSGGLNYNKFIWPAKSDLAMLNPDIVYEAIPPDDGTVFLNSVLSFSASQGQDIGYGVNPVENMKYMTLSQFMFVDSTSTNSVYNTGKCIIPVVGTTSFLDSGNLSGVLTAENTPLTIALTFS